MLDLSGMRVGSVSLGWGYFLGKRKADIYVCDTSFADWRYGENDLRRDGLGAAWDGTLSKDHDGWGKLYECEIVLLRRAGTN